MGESSSSDEDGGGSDHLQLTSKNPQAVSTTADKENLPLDENCASSLTAFLLQPKRKYTRANRAGPVAAAPVLPLHKRKKIKIALIAEQSAIEARNVKCCGKNCFRQAKDMEFLKLKRTQVLEMNRADRKRFLIDLFDIDSGTFAFDGTFVCSKFLTKAFQFSNDTICGVKGTPKARSTAVVDPIPRISPTSKRDIIVAFLRQLAETQGDRNKCRISVRFT